MNLGSSLTATHKSGICFWNRKILSRKLKRQICCGKDRPKSTSNDNEASDERSKSEENLSIDGKKLGWSFFPQEEDLKDIEDDSEVEVPFIDLTNPSQTESLPDLTRSQVLNTCLGVCGGIVLMSLILRTFASRSPEVLGNEPELINALLSLTPAFDLSHGLIGLAAAGVVSLARTLLYQQWDEFKDATDRSNTQVLTPLQNPDLFVVSVFPGISEELLFRGSLIPSFYPDWRGVLLAGVIFGVLHKGGGRNFAFVIWASAVGCLYGIVYLITQDIYVPILAHSTANLYSAFYWKMTIPTKQDL